MVHFKQQLRLLVYYMKQLLWFSITKIVTTLLINPKGPVELGNPNTGAEIKLYLFLYTLNLKTVSSG